MGYEKRSNKKFKKITKNFNLGQAYFYNNEFYFCTDKGLVNTETFLVDETIKPGMDIDPKKGYEADWYIIQIIDRYVNRDNINKKSLPLK